MAIGGSDLSFEQFFFNLECTSLNYFFLRVCLWPESSRVAGI